MEQRVELAGYGNGLEELHDNNHYILTKITASCYLPLTRLDSNDWTPDLQWKTDRLDKKREW